MSEDERDPLLTYRTHATVQHPADVEDDPLSRFKARPEEPQKVPMLRFIVGRGQETKVDSWAFPYTTLQSLELETERRLVLRFVRSVVTIEGERLGELFLLISEQKATELQVTSGAPPDANGSPFQVSTIRVELDKGSGAHEEEPEALGNAIPHVIELPRSNKKALARQKRSSPKRQEKADLNSGVSSGIRRAR